MPCLISAQGLNLSQSKVDKTIVQAALNDLAVFAAGYEVTSKSENVGYSPRGNNVVLSGLAVVAYSASSGGELVS